ncbi:hypothetical protein COU77_00570 [Candidatus Peregrinibacteria bacterium CG10_big_fil_rev_8_21_14_0_10_49_16]|nr:MAG: hypothetical protein COW95_01720 [Candidatus Peregrinibacteria bacterium CG22_combo_CG10-13_8_21_14_all_49_11]PIR52391.1 MAG: hypothetical protein COU77_00570 [Candidatus Peregrinibacteria bacterium CG10_big_fil_rev_8_21_14_0_10_49_16]
MFSAVAILSIRSPSRSFLSSSLTHTTLAFENSAPQHVKLSLQHARGNSLIELENPSDSVLLFSTPDSWFQWEIRGADITELQEDPPSLGFIRWHIPPLSTVSFTAKTVTLPLAVHHPVPHILTLSVTEINLDRGTSHKGTYLLQQETRMIQN